MAYLLSSLGFNHALNASLGMKSGRIFHLDYRIQGDLTGFCPAGCPVFIRLLANICESRRKNKPGKPPATPRVYWIFAGFRRKLAKDSERLPDAL